MKTCRIGILGASLAALACSGRYEVGGMDPEVGGSGGSGSSVAGGPHVAGSQSGGGGGTTSGNPGNDSGPTCGLAGAPTVVMGPFVAPSVVWARVMPFIWGSEMHAPPTELPTQVGLDWASELVDQAVAQAVAETDGVPGANWFIARWLGIEGELDLEDDYAGRLADENNVLLEELLTRSRASGYVGVFSELGWLLEHRSIPGRGAGMIRAVYDTEVPAPPPSVDQTVDTGLPDRQAIIMATQVQAACAACHNILNGPGFALGSYDREGQLRTLDHGQPIDVTGSYGFDGVNGLIFDGIADFGQKAAGSCDANRALVSRFVRIALTQQGNAVDDDSQLVAQRERIAQAFTHGGRSYVALVRAYAQSELVLK